MFTIANKPSSVWLALLLAGLACRPAWIAAQAKTKILVVNSDSSVEKYRQTQDGFRQQLDAYADSIVELDLGGADNPGALEKRIDQEKPDLIYSIGSKAYQLAHRYGKGRPMLFSSVINWQRFDMEKNTYGVANELSLNQELSLLRYMFPAVKRIGILYTPEFSRERIAEAQKYAKEVGFTLIERSVEDRDALDGALNALLPTIDLLWLIADPGVLSDRAAVETIFSAGEKLRKPIYAYSESYIAYGASLAVAADTPTIGRQAANLAQSILRRQPIADAVQMPAGSHITLNVCQLGKLKTAYNQDALDSVNKLVDCP